MGALAILALVEAEAVEEEQSWDDSWSWKEWTCSSCGFRNWPRNKVCGGNGPMGCKKPFRENSNSRYAPWVCECGFKNNASNESCGGIGLHGCGKLKPIESDGGLEPEGLKKDEA